MSMEEKKQIEKDENVKEVDMTEEEKEVKVAVKEKIKTEDDKDIQKVDDKEINKMKDELDVNFVEKLLQSNEVEFTFNDIKYRVRKPSFGERQSGYKKRIEYYTELLQEKDKNGNFKYKDEASLRKLYKERGVDIDEMDNQFKTLEQRKKLLQKKLGKALKDDKSDKDLTTYKEEIEKINDSQKEISAKKSVYLEYSLENQTSIFTYSYLASLITEKQEGDKWVKVWENYEDFENDEEVFINTVLSYTFVMVIPSNELTR